MIKACAEYFVNARCTLLVIIATANVHGQILTATANG